MKEIIIAFIAAAIPAIASVVGVVVSNNKSKAVTQVKLDNLTEEVKKHNNFAVRVPVLEEKVSVSNHRLTNIEEELRDLREKVS